PGLGEPWRHADWQKLWLSLQGAPWRTLALVAAGKGAPPDFTLNIAISLARTGMMHLGVPIRVADATRVTLAHLIQVGDEIENAVDAGDMVLIALPPTGESPTTVSLAQSANQTLLCVLLSKMKTSEAKKTVEEIGKARFIGTATFRG